MIERRRHSVYRSVSDKTLVVVLAHRLVVAAVLGTLHLGTESLGSLALFLADASPLLRLGFPCLVTGFLLFQVREHPKTLLMNESLLFVLGHLYEGHVVLVRKTLILYVTTAAK